jgi:hypothetical protein
MHCILLEARGTRHRSHQQLQTIKRATGVIHDNTLRSPTSEAPTSVSNRMGATARGLICCSGSTKCRHSRPSETPLTHHTHKPSEEENDYTRGQRVFNCFLESMMYSLVQPYQGAAREHCLV